MSRGRRTIVRIAGLRDDGTLRHWQLDMKFRVRLADNLKPGRGLGRRKPDTPEPGGSGGSGSPAAAAAAAPQHSGGMPPVSGDPSESAADCS